MSNDAVTGQIPAEGGAGSEAQRRVDAIVAEAKRGIWKPQYQPASPTPQPPMCPKLIDRRLSEEIQYVQRLLEMTGDQFAGDPVILQRHSRTMQGFDLMSQILGHIARVVTADDRESAIDGIGMHDLRARLKRQSL